MAGRHSRRILAFLRKSSKTIFKSSQTAETIKHSAQNCGFGENSWQKRVSLRNRDRHFDETAEKRQHGGKKLREKANCKIKGQKKPCHKGIVMTCFWSVMTCSGQKNCAKNRIVMTLFWLLWLNQHASMCFGQHQCFGFENPNWKTSIVGQKGGCNKFFFYMNLCFAKCEKLSFLFAIFG